MNIEKIKELLDALPGNGYKTVGGIVLTILSVIFGALNFITPEVALGGISTGATLAGVGYTHKVLKGQV